jgi:4-amino-4-deoxy-L-arabinose transferase-like glycosyltransferase
MSSLAGWLTILITAIFAVWIAGYSTGVIVLLLFALSPTFLGHAQNNLKDIPFAMAYITGTFYILKFLFSGSKSSFRDIILLTLSVAFCISIRAGGLILICYLFFFFFLFYLIKYFMESRIDLREIQKKLIWIFVMTIVSFFLSTLLWPFALQNPIVNIFKSYHVMTHFPDTFRQVFEGRVEWSDYMPWYYLIKSMAITIPLTVLAGLIIFIILLKRIFNSRERIIYGFLLFTVLFPVVFVIFEKSNLYSSWRQFLFIYPGISLLKANIINGDSLFCLFCFPFTRLNL